MLDVKDLARRGAQVRYAELLSEIDGLRKAFPGVGGTAKVLPTRTRRKMSAKARKAVADRMKKYWAERKKNAAKK